MKLYRDGDKKMANEFEAEVEKEVGKDGFYERMV